MKKFNLEKALAGAPVVTRDGQEVTQLVLFKGVDGAYVLYGVIDGVVRHWTKSGNCWAAEDESSSDIFMAPVKRVVYGIINKKTQIIAETQGLHDTAESAKARIQEAYLGSHRVAVAKIEWEE